MEIPHPQSTRLILDDCRRLTGPSLVWDKTGAILDVLVEDIELDVVLDCWYQHLEKLQTDIGWHHRETTHRRFENGFNLLIEAPIDALYSATLVLETAWYFTACDLLAVKAGHIDEMQEAIRQSIREEANPG
ncbi:MAG: Mur ligase, partial [Gammaproteobacteria bacterium]|nr:Mur ligase [Gammaproteobacteria bacterium]